MAVELVVVTEREEGSEAGGESAGLASAITEGDEGSRRRGVQCWKGFINLFSFHPSELLSIVSDQIFPPGDALTVGRRSAGGGKSCHTQPSRTFYVMAIDDWYENIWL